MDFRSDHQQAADRMSWERFISRQLDGEIEAATARLADRWPDQERVASWPMKRALLLGQPLSPAWQLVRTLDVVEDSVNDALFAQWIERGALDGMSRLRLTGAGLSVASLVRAVTSLPSLRAVEVVGRAWGDSVPSLRSVTGRSPLVRLSLHGCGGRFITAILDDAMTGTLRELHVSRIEGDERWWRSDRVAQLHTLSVHGFRGGADEVRSLAESLPPSLIGLSFRSDGRGQTIVPLLQRELPLLQDLDLSRNGIADPVLVNAPLMRAPRLRRLSLGYNPVRGRVIFALGEQLASLEVLDLCGTHAGDVGLDALPAEAPLEHIDVSHSSCTARGILGVVRKFGGSLRHLALIDTGFDTDAARQLGTDVSVPMLETLDVSGCPIGPAGLVHLLVDAGLTELRTLVASGTRLSGCAFERVPRVPKLEHLGLDHTRLSVTGASLLFSDEGLPNLSTLSLSTNHLDASALRSLAAFVAIRGLAHVTLDESVMASSEELAAVLVSGAADLVDLRVGQSLASQQPLLAGLASGDLRRLRRMDLLGLILDASGLRSVLGNPSLSSLESLTVQVDDESAVAELLEHSVLSRLRLLTVHGGAVEQELAIMSAPHRAPWLEAMVLRTP